MHISTGCFYLFFFGVKRAVIGDENKKKAQSCAFFRWVGKMIVFLLFYNQLFNTESMIRNCLDKKYARRKFFRVENVLC